MNGKILNKEALKAWILSKMVTLTNNLLATTPGISAMDAAQGPVIQGQIDAINSNLGDIPQFFVDQDTGKITGYKTKEGADAVFPFSKNLHTGSAYISANQYSSFTAEINDITLLVGYINGNNVMTYVKGIGSISSNASVSINGSTVTVYDRIGSGTCRFYYM